VNATVDRVTSQSHVPTANLAKSVGGTGLTYVNSKLLYYRHEGIATGAPVLFIHGLGGTNEVFSPLIADLGLRQTNSLHLFDFEGHGLSPTSALSTISISSLAADAQELLKSKNISSGVTVVAHSMGCLVALELVLKNPQLAKKLVLLGPPPNPLPEAASQGSLARAALARTKGMAAVVDAVVDAGTSSFSKQSSILGVTAVRLCLLGQDPEGYAKACTALANATKAMNFNDVKADTLIVTGSEDKVSPPALCEKYAHTIPSCKSVVLQDVGHWHIFENVKEVGKAVRSAF
jgi:pimeloyl-ACP methyl ester carboxylesterase